MDQLKEVFNQTGLLSHAWMLLLSMLAGIVANIERIQRGEQGKFMFFMLVYDILASSFMGLLAMYFCLSQGIDIYLMAAIVGVFAHTGTKGINVVLKLVAAKVPRFDMEEK